MKEQFFKISKLASTPPFPRSSLYVGWIIKKYNEGELVTPIDYSKQPENIFTPYLNLLEFQKAQAELNELKKQLSRKGKRGSRRNRHLIKSAKARIRRIKIN
jgi:hypothetical protein